MIAFVEKVITDKLGHLLPKGSKLVFLKLCTPTSGKTLNDKVIFLVFKKGEGKPFLCVKTVRSYGAREIIVKNFNNLKTLHNLVGDSQFADMFVTPLYLHDDGEFVFSIETACIGTKMISNEENFKKVLQQHIALHAYLAKKDPEARDVVSDVKRLIAELGLESADETDLFTYIDGLNLSIKLPKIIQHGDMTFDNLLGSSRGLCVVDYDFVGVTDVPGFDLFGFCKRFYRKGEILAQCKKCLKDYFTAISVVLSDEEIHGLCFLYHAVEYLKRKPSGIGNLTAKKIISDFEVL